MSALPRLNETITELETSLRKLKELGPAAGHSEAGKRCLKEVADALCKHNRCVNSYVEELAEKPQMDREIADVARRAISEYLNAQSAIKVHAAQWSHTAPVAGSTLCQCQQRLAEVDVESANDLWAQMHRSELTAEGFELAKEKGFAGMVSPGKGSSAPRANAPPQAEASDWQDADVQLQAGHASAPGTTAINGAPSFAIGIELRDTGPQRPVRRIDVELRVGSHFLFWLLLSTVLVSAVDFAYARVCATLLNAALGVLGAVVSALIAQAFLRDTIKRWSGCIFKSRRNMVVLSSVSMPLIAFLVWSLTACHWWAPRPELKLPRVRVTPLFRRNAGQASLRYVSSELPSAAFYLSDFVDNQTVPIQLQLSLDNESRQFGEQSWFWSVSPPQVVVRPPGNESSVALAPDRISDTCLVTLSAVARGRSLFLPDADSQIITITMENDR